MESVKDEAPRIALYQAEKSEFCFIKLFLGLLLAGHIGAGLESTRLTDNRDDSRQVRGESRRPIRRGRRALRQGRRADRVGIPASTWNPGQQARPREGLRPSRKGVEGPTCRNPAHQIGGLPNFGLGRRRPRSGSLTGLIGGRPCRTPTTSVGDFEGHVGQALDRLRGAVGGEHRVQVGRPINGWSAGGGSLV